MKGPLPIQQVLTGGFDIVTEAQIKAGQINDLDLRAFRALLELEQAVQKRFLVTFLRALELDDVILLICDGSIGQLIGTKGANIQSLENALKKRVRIVAFSADPKKLLSDMLGPRVKISSKTTVFAPEGERTRLVVNKKSAGNRLPRHGEKLSHWVSELTKSQVEVSFE